MTTLQVGVKVFLVNKEGKYLLMRRADDKYQEVMNKWDIPGGRIDPGSTLLENLLREVKEETGLSLLGTPRLLAAQDIFSGDEKRHIVRLTYIGEAAEGEVLLSDEHTEYAWLTLAEMRSKEKLDHFARELLENRVIV